LSELLKECEVALRACGEGGRPFQLLPDGSGRGCSVVADGDTDVGLGRNVGSFDSNVDVDKLNLESRFDDVKMLDNDGRRRSDEEEELTLRSDQTVRKTLSEVDGEGREKNVHPKVRDETSTPVFSLIPVWEKNRQELGVCR
jgi:hypothetical protein